MCLKFLLAKGARKETSRILATLNIYGVSTFELRLIENHYNPSSPHNNTLPRGRTSHSYIAIPCFYSMVCIGELLFNFIIIANCQYPVYPSFVAHYGLPNTAAGQ
jgi:hypothetical protein